jgi:hypothetical protein
MCGVMSGTATATERSTVSPQDMLLPFAPQPGVMRCVLPVRESKEAWFPKPWAYRRTSTRDC